MVYEFLDLLVESYGTWLLLQRLVDASKDSDIPKNVPFAFAINNRNTESPWNDKTCTKYIGCSEMVCGKEGSKMIERSIQVCAEYAYDKR